MSAPTTSVPDTVHFYDTDRHVIACGVRGFPDRSTKHERSVTCPGCGRVLADRRASRTAPAPLVSIDGGIA